MTKIRCNCDCSLKRESDNICMLKEVCLSTKGACNNKLKLPKSVIKAILEAYGSDKTSDKITDNKARIPNEDKSISNNKTQISNEDEPEFVDLYRVPRKVTYKDIDISTDEIYEENQDNREHQEQEGREQEEQDNQEQQEPDNPEQNTQEQDTQEQAEQSDTVSADIDLNDLTPVDIVDLEQFETEVSNDKQDSDKSNRESKDTVIPLYKTLSAEEEKSILFDLYVSKKKDLDVIARKLEYPSTNYAYNRLEKYKIFGSYTDTDRKKSKPKQYKNFEIFVADKRAKAHERYEAIVQDYNNHNMTAKEIAAKNNCCVATVYNAIQRLNKDKEQPE